MIQLKTGHELERMQACADILSEAHGVVASAITPGVPTWHLDHLAAEFIYKQGAQPSFKGYQGFAHTLCISVNNCIIHGTPDTYVLKEGDIVSIDCGVYYNGLHTDAAFTYGIGKISQEVLDLLRVTKAALYKGISCANASQRVGDISSAIQLYVEGNSYTVVREFSGHGIGRDLHEYPEVPNYGEKGSGAKLRTGMTLAIEPMVNMGKRQIYYGDKGILPAVYTIDNKPSAHFEHTVAITDGRPRILTNYAHIEKALQS